jgi:hypothetical protein
LRLLVAAAYLPLYLLSEITVHPVVGHTINLSLAPPKVSQVHAAVSNVLTLDVTACVHILMSSSTGSLQCGMVNIMNKLNITIFLF